MFFLKKIGYKSKEIDFSMAVENTNIPNHPRSSSARWLLLSRFKRFEDANRFNNDPNWEYALNEKPERVIKELVRERLLEPAGLIELLDYKFTPSDLEDMLKEKGLPVTGRKEELLSRLIEHDEKAMVHSTKGMKLYRYTSMAAELVENYLEEEARRREAAEKSVLDLLTLKQYPQAALAVAQFESAHVFARRTGIDWKNFDRSEAMEVLSSIFSKTPSILKGMNKYVLDQLRVPTAMMYLWGKNTAEEWLPKGLKTGTRFTGDTACGMLLFHAYYLRRVAGFKSAKKAGEKNKRYRIIAASDSCPECKKAADKTYRRLRDVPQLPHAACTYKYGCRCTLIAGAGE